MKWNIDIWNFKLDFLKTVFKQLEQYSTEATIC